MSGPQKRLRKFMLQKLKDGSCPGVEWVDERKGLFKIPWYHINKVEAKDLPKHFKIFVEWAKYTDKYQEGSGKPDYTTFKTQLRCALTKIPDFKEVKEGGAVDGNTLHPYKVYQFTQWISSKEEVQSPDSTFHDVNTPKDGISFNLQNFLGGNEAESKNPVNFDSASKVFIDKEDVIDFLDSDMPMNTVDEIHSWPCFSFNETTQSGTHKQLQDGQHHLHKEMKGLLQEYNPNQVLQSCSQQQTLQHTQSQGGQSIPSQNVFVSQLGQGEHLQRSNLMLQTSVVMQPQARNNVQPLQNQQATLYMPSQTPNYCQIGQNQQPQPSTNFMLNAMPLMEVDPVHQAMLLADIQGARMPKEGSLPETHFAPGGSFHADDENAIMQDFQSVLQENGLDMTEGDAFSGQFPEVLAAIPTLSTTPARPPQSIAMSASNNHDEIHGASGGSEAVNKQARQEFKMKIVVYYGCPKIKVMEEEVGEKGCRLYFGEKVFDNTRIDESMYGPKTVQQLHLPSIENLTHESKLEFSRLKKSDSQSQVITTALEKMSRGVVLQFENGNIFAKRLCACTVFVCDAKHNTEKLERNSQLGTKVFDFENFKQLCNSGKPPSHFYLTFGKEAESSKPDPLEKVLLKAEITHCPAHDVVVRSHLLTDSNLSSMDLLLSDPNSLDKLETNFKAMALKTS